MDIGVIQRLAIETSESYSVEIRVYVEDLFEKISTGTIVDRGVVENVSWQPQPNECHNNVDFWCKYDSGYNPARGWLVYDFTRQANIVLFLQHSVLIDPKGDLLDITPTNVDERYPFIFLSDSDEKYFALESDLVNGNLFYVKKKKKCLTRSGSALPLVAGRSNRCAVCPPAAVGVMCLKRVRA